MKHAARYTPGLALGLFLVGSTAFAAFAPLELDRVHSKVGFTAATILFDVDGHFREFSVVHFGPSRNSISFFLSMAFVSACAGSFARFFHSSGSAS